MHILSLLGSFLLFFFLQHLLEWWTGYQSSRFSLALSDSGRDRLWGRTKFLDQTPDMLHSWWCSLRCSSRLGGHGVCLWLTVSSWCWWFFLHKENVSKTIKIEIKYDSAYFAYFQSHTQCLNARKRNLRLLMSSWWWCFLHSRWCRRLRCSSRLDGHGVCLWLSVYSWCWCCFLHN